MENKGGRKAIVTVFLALIVLLFTHYVNQPKEEYGVVTTVAGVQVKSEIPMSELENWNDLGLFEDDNLAVIACNLQLSSIANTDFKTYWVHVEQGEAGISIMKNEAFLRGNSNTELLAACHAFSCMISGISCPPDLSEIQRLTYDRNQLNIVIDENISAAASMAYSELMGPLAFYQAEQADADQDGVLTTEEVASNKVFIYPYIRKGDKCELQPLTNMMQQINLTNVSVDCDRIQGIYIRESSENEILVDGENIRLGGDARRLHIESLIVGNVISPRWNLRFHGVI